jgi:formate hydrogenlyase subunit 6/NADH:ubiquinone oxidoreductase subunit I
VREGPLWTSAGRLFGPTSTVDWPLEILVHEGRPRGHPVFDEDRCDGCGKCAKACPCDCIELEGTSTPVVDVGTCVRCGLCVDACPDGAVTLEGQRDIAVIARGDLMLGPGSLPRPQVSERAPRRLMRLALGVEEPRQVHAEELLRRRLRKTGKMED